MAFLTVNYMSEALMRTVTVNVILPADKFPASDERRRKEYKTLYLLHGIMGNHTDWVNNTLLQKWAEEKDLAVVMPAGENMFYLDQQASHALYGEFIGRELVEVTRRMFPLSVRREDTYIAGLSMGGYGALRNGLKYADTFGKIGALSAALILDELDKKTDDVTNFWESRTYAEFVFGELSKVMESDKNPLWIMRERNKRNDVLPEIYMACGTEDPLYPANIKYRDNFRAEGAEVAFAEETGGHDWNFWNTYIKKFIDWLPLGDETAGMNSGNVGL